MQNMGQKNRYLKIRNKTKILNAHSLLLIKLQHLWEDRNISPRLLFNPWRYSNSAFCQFSEVFVIVITYLDVGRGRCTWEPRSVASSRWRLSRRGLTRSHIRALCRQCISARRLVACTIARQTPHFWLSLITVINSAKKFQKSQLLKKLRKFLKKSTAFRRI